MRRLFHFLGSIHFAITLISFTAIFVAVGTWLESLADSHAYAATYTYRHPAFLTLLGLFFVNILFSALRRYPFKLKHVPFLITHLGLLAVITGTFIKILFGVQGHLLITEGSGSHTLRILDLPSLHIETAEKEMDIPFKKKDISEFNLNLIAYYPHSKKSYLSWIKGNQATILGVNPFPVTTWKPSDSIPPPTQTRRGGMSWNLWAFRTDQIQQLLEKIPLTPSLILIETSDENLFVIALDRSGRIYSEEFSKDRLTSIIIYHEGYGGYTVPFKIPFFEKEIRFEAPLEIFATPLPPSKKLEELKPLVTLTGEDQKKIALPYDATGSSLKWPILNGNALIRFQPHFQKIPYHIRLKRARKATYPNSTQAYSFEADLVIQDLSSSENEEVTLSMNHVHETSRGYRFYLSSMGPDDEGACKQVQIVVNQDPAKTLLTYPGGCLISLGIFLLFWFRPYANRY